MVLRQDYLEKISIYLLVLCQDYPEKISIYLSITLTFTWSNISFMWIIPDSVVFKTSKVNNLKFNHCQIFLMVKLSEISWEIMCVVRMNILK